MKIEDKPEPNKPKELATKRKDRRVSIGVTTTLRNFLGESPFALHQQR